MTLRELRESISELRSRFFSERPPTDPDRQRDRVDNDGMREMFARAESFATMGPPVDATLAPVSAPENVQLLANGGSRDGRQTHTIDSKGMSRGIESGRNALITECGWSAEAANALANQVINGQMTEGQFMRVVEEHLEKSKSSGQVNPNRHKRAKETRSRGRDPKGERRRFGIAEGISNVVDTLQGGERR